jgi:hypothetical protein
MQMKIYFLPWLSHLKYTNTRFSYPDFGLQYRALEPRIFRMFMREWNSNLGITSAQQTYVYPTTIEQNFLQVLTFLITKECNRLQSQQSERTCHEKNYCVIFKRFRSDAVLNVSVHWYLHFPQNIVPEEKFSAASLSLFSVRLLLFLALSLLPRQHGLAYHWQGPYLLPVRTEKLHTTCLRI